MYHTILRILCCLSNQQLEQTPAPEQPTIESRTEHEQTEVRNVQELVYLAPLLNPVIAHRIHDHHQHNYPIVQAIRCIIDLGEQHVHQMQRINPMSLRARHCRLYHDDEAQSIEMIHNTNNDNRESCLNTPQHSMNYAYLMHQRAGRSIALHPQYHQIYYVQYPLYHQYYQPGIPFYPPIYRRDTSWYQFYYQEQRYSEEKSEY